jgi:glycolate oxidase iron-sulfur subunit
MKKTVDDQLLQDAREMVSQCDRCGTCLTVCPLFSIQDVEKVSARGKNTIIRALAEGGLKPAPEVLAVANFCLLCQTCVTNCPNKIKTDEAMINVRQYLTDRTGGVSAKYKAIGEVMKRKGIVKLAAGLLSFLRKSRLNKLFPYGMVPEEYTRTHFLTAFAGPAALGRQTVASNFPVTEKTKVAYFQGCGMKMMFPEAAAETVKILKTTTQLIVKDNVCCGIPHLAHGLRDDFLFLTKKNIALYEGAEIVVTDCASCGGVLKHVAGYFADDPVWKDRAAAFSRKVIDLTEYLVKIGFTPRRRVDVTLTYHDPCHLVRGQGVKNQPRELLKAAGKFIEMKEADTCCGGAGSFHLDYPDIAKKILDKKQENIEKTGASIVVSGCPGCLIQLSKAAKASNGKFKAMHISQVI